MLCRTLFEGKTAQGEQAVFEPWESTETAVYIVINGAVTSGQVVIETAHAPDFSGTWQVLSSVPAISDSTTRVGLSGAYMYVRVRISSAIVSQDPQNPASASAYVVAYH